MVTAVCLSPHVRHVRARPRDCDRSPRRLCADLRRGMPEPVHPLDTGPLLAPDSGQGNQLDVDHQGGVRRDVRRRVPGSSEAERRGNDQSPRSADAHTGHADPPEGQRRRVGELKRVGRLVRAARGDHQGSAREPHGELDVRVGRGLGDSTASDTDIGELKSRGAGLQCQRCRERVQLGDRPGCRAIGRHRRDVTADRYQAATPADGENRQRGAGHHARAAQAKGVERVGHPRRIVPRRRVQSS